MKLRDLRHGLSAAWPPGWGGSYKAGDTFPLRAVGTLKDVESSKGGRGVRISIEFEGMTHSAAMVWDGDKPSPDEVVAALRPRIGTKIANLADIEICYPQQNAIFKLMRYRMPAPVAGTRQPRCAFDSETETLPDHEIPARVVPRRDAMTRPEPGGAFVAQRVIAKPTEPHITKTTDRPALPPGRRSRKVHLTAAKARYV